MSDSHYFDIVNIDRYDTVLGAPWLNTHGAILDFKSHSIHIAMGEIKMFNVFMKHSHHSVGYKAQHGNKAIRKGTTPPKEVKLETL